MHFIQYSLAGWVPEVAEGVVPLIRYRAAALIRVNGAEGEAVAIQRRANVYLLRC